MSDNGTDQSQEQLAAQISAVLGKYPKVAEAIENIEIAIEELGQLQATMMEAREKEIIDPSIEMKTFEAQKKIAVGLDNLTSSLRGVDDQQMLGIAIGTHNEASAYLQSIVFSIHYARHAQKHGTDHIHERLFSEAYMLLQRQQESGVQQPKGKIILPR